MIWIFKFGISSVLTFSLIWFGILNSHEVDFNLVPRFFDLDNFYAFEFLISNNAFFNFFWVYTAVFLENNRSNKIEKSLKEKIKELRKSDMNSKN